MLRNTSIALNNWANIKFSGIYITTIHSRFISFDDVVITTIILWIKHKVKYCSIRLQSDTEVFVKTGRYERRHTFAINQINLVLVISEHINKLNVFYLAVE